MVGTTTSGIIVISNTTTILFSSFAAYYRGTSLGYAGSVRNLVAVISFNLKRAPLVFLDRVCGTLDEEDANATRDDASGTWARRPWPFLIPAFPSWTTDGGVDHSMVVFAQFELSVLAQFLFWERRFIMSRSTRDRESRSRSSQEEFRSSQEEFAIHPVVAERLRNLPFFVPGSDRRGVMTWDVAAREDAGDWRPFDFHWWQRERKKKARWWVKRSSSDGETLQSGGGTGGKSGGSSSDERKKWPVQSVVEPPTGRNVQTVVELERRLVFGRPAEGQQGDDRQQTTAPGGNDPSRYSTRTGSGTSTAAMILHSHNRTGAVPSAQVRRTLNLLRPANGYPLTPADLNMVGKIHQDPSDAHQQDPLAAPSEGRTTSLLKALNIEAPRRPALKAQHKLSCDWDNIASLAPACKRWVALSPAAAASIAAGIISKYDLNPGATLSHFPPCVFVAEVQAALEGEQSAGALSGFTTDYVEPTTLDQQEGSRRIQRRTAIPFNLEQVAEELVLMRGQCRTRQGEQEGRMAAGGIMVPLPAGAVGAPAGAPAAPGWAATPPRDVSVLVAGPPGANAHQPQTPPMNSSWIPVEVATTGLYPTTFTIYRHYSGKQSAVQNELLYRPEDTLSSAPGQHEEDLHSPFESTRAWNDFGILRPPPAPLAHQPEGPRERAAEWSTTGAASTTTIFPVDVVIPENGGKNIFLSAEDEASIFGKPAGRPALGPAQFSPLGAQSAQPRLFVRMKTGVGSGGSQLPGRRLDLSQWQVENEKPFDLMSTTSSKTSRGRRRREQQRIKRRMSKESSSSCAQTQSSGSSEQEILQGGQIQASILDGKGEHVDGGDSTLIRDANKIFRIITHGADPDTTYFQLPPNAHVDFSTGALLGGEISSTLFVRLADGEWRDVLISDLVQDSLRSSGYVGPPPFVWNGPSSTLFRTDSQGPLNAVYVVLRRWAVLPSGVAGWENLDWEGVSAKAGPSQGVRWAVVAGAENGHSQQLELYPAPVY